MCIILGATKKKDFCVFCSALFAFRPCMMVCVYSDESFFGTGELGAECVVTVACFSVGHLTYSKSIGL